MARLGEAVRADRLTRHVPTDRIDPSGHLTSDDSVRHPSLCRLGGGAPVVDTGWTMNPLRLTPARCLLVGALAGTLSAADWPSWRGPRQDNSTPETRFPERWSKSEHIRWRT